MGTVGGALHPDAMYLTSARNAGAVGAEQIQAKHIVNVRYNRRQVVIYVALSRLDILFSLPPLPSAFPRSTFDQCPESI